MTTGRKIFIAIVVLYFVIGIAYHSFYKKGQQEDQIQEDEGANAFPKAPAVRNEEEIKSLVKRHKVVVLFIHSDGCPPCKQMAPKIDQLAHENKRKDVFIAQVKVREIQEFCAANGIAGVPTTLIFDNGELKKRFVGYNQDIIGNIVSAIDELSLLEDQKEGSKIATSIIEVSNEKEIEQLANQNKVVVLFVYMEECPYCKSLSPKIDQLAHENKREGVIFVKVERDNAEALTKRDDVGPYPTVVIYKEGKLAKSFQGCSQEPITSFANAIDALLEG